MQDIKRYEAFVTHVAGLLTPAVYSAVQRMNVALETREGFNDVKVIVTGGKALQFFFGDAPELLTNDVDVKVTSGRADDKDRCAAVSREFAALAANTARRYLEEISRAGDLARVVRSESGDMFIAVAGYDDFAILLRDEGWVWHRQGVVENVVFSYKNLVDNKVANAPFVDSIFFTNTETMGHFISDAEYDAGEPSIEDLLAYYATGTSSIEDAYQSTLGRKGFYRQKLTYVDAGGKLYVASLGYVIHDMVLMMNKMYDYTQQVANFYRNPQYVGFMLGGGSLLREARSPIKLKYQRYLAKYRRVITALSDPKYLNHHSVSRVLEDGIEVVAAPFCVFGQGSNTREALLREVFASRLLPDTETVRAVLDGMNFDTLCDYALQLTPERR